MAGKETVVSLRRHFHENPELSQKEFKTMDTIEEFLHKYGIETVRVPHGGVFGFLDSGKPGWTMLMRADIDALPIKEDPVNMAKERVCISENEGIMHACGHDGHMAMLLTEAKILAQHKDEWEGKIVFMFEEAEEMGERGIAPLLRYLRDNKIHIDTCFGTHVMWNLPAGKVSILYGSALAGAYFFRVKLHGKSGHGSRPDMAQSPIECFISIASELRSYRMRAVDPSDSLTYSFGCVQAGHEPNIIPDELMFAGTARCTKNDDGLAFRDTFLKVTKGIAELHGLTAEIVEDQYFRLPSIRRNASILPENLSLKPLEAMRLIRTARCGWPRKPSPLRNRHIRASSSSPASMIRKSEAEARTTHRNSTLQKTASSQALPPLLPMSQELWQKSPKHRSSIRRTLKAC